MTAIGQTDLPLEVIYNKVDADSRFTLHYLKAVDAVIDVATETRNSAESSEWAIKQTLTRLNESGGCDKPLDPDGKLARLSKKVEDKVKEFILAIQMLDGEFDGSMIRAEDSAAVSVSYEEAVVALQKLHDVMVDVRWAVMEHDADLEEADSKVFKNAEDLVADLRRC